ncbi:Hypothetical protein DHA2_151076 [Giardia duodenalis]|uniref:EGF-like domain-containing protein n=1 Tax=Giardia intestinalis TaxID=5741 RepID=V6TK19_GIAIN|nr:Hypothetical protein DHA2_151076 [Giardia intestinalis]
MLALTLLSAFLSNDPCTSDGVVCSNHGVCEEQDGIRLGCTCYDGFYSPGPGLCYDLACKTEVGICNNGGACVNKDNGRMGCVCDLLHLGEHCESCNPKTAMLLDNVCVPILCTIKHPTDISLSQVCGGGGHPILLDNGHYSCNCTKPGYLHMGSVCIHQSCISQTGEICGGNGVCLNMKCVCYKGHSGALCTLEKPLVFCDEGYTRIGFDCFPDECLSRGLVCGSNGRCVDGKKPKCLCNKGFETVGSDLCVPMECIKDGAVCPHGNCVLLEAAKNYECVCSPGYVQTSDGTCISQSCVSSISDEGLVICHNRGLCINDTCLCNNNFGGIKCSSCNSGFVFVQAEEDSQGRCISVNCLSYAVSNVAQQIVRFREIPDNYNSSLLVCDGFGVCEASSSLKSNSYLDYKCHCSPGAIPYKNRCYSTFCFNASTPNVICNNHGYCKGGTCVCDVGYGGFSCELNLISCPFGTLDVQGSCIPEACVTDGSICNGLGDCVDTLVYNETSGLPVYKCLCRGDFQFVLGHGCVHPACIDPITNAVCENGKCITAGAKPFCQCDPGFIGLQVEEHEGIICVSASCVTFGNSICNRNAGKCIKKGISGNTVVYGCACEPAYTGTHCEHCSSQAMLIDDRCYPPECLMPASSHNPSLLVCGGHGQCSYHLVEEGADNYEYVCLCNPASIVVGNTCTMQSCVNPVDPTKICSNAGYCNSKGICVCDPNVKGEYCETISIVCLPGETFVAGACVPDPCISSLPFPAICGGHGTCSKIQNEFKCVCDPGYVFLPTMNQEKLYGCVPKACNVSGVYCPYGECREINKVHSCHCKQDFRKIEERCVPRLCVAKNKLGELTECSGHGDCVALTNGTSYPIYSTEAHMHFLSQSDNVVHRFQCACKELYTGALCSTCVHGSVATDDGHCTPEHCLTIRHDNSTAECNGAGVCTKILGKWQCVCVHHGTTPERTCQPDSCFAEGSTLACSGHGVCHRDGCICNAGFSGSACESAASLEGSSLPTDTQHQQPMPTTKTARKHLPGRRLHHEPVGSSGPQDTAARADQKKETQGQQRTAPEAALRVVNVHPSNGTCPLDYSALEGLCYPTECVVGERLCGYPHMLDKSIRNNNSTILTDGFVANLTSSLLCRLDHSTARHRCLCVPPFKHIPDHGCAPAGCVSDTGFVCPHGECLYSDGEYLCKCEDGFVMLNSTCVHAQCVKNGAACNWTPKARGGTCVQNATGAWTCQCNPGYVGRHCDLCDKGMTAVDGACAPHNLVKLYANKTRLVCGGSGKIVGDAPAALACQCDEDAVPHGQLCASKKCLNTRLAGSVCTGHGECYKDACVCAEGYHGDLCDCRVRNIGAVAGVTASTAVFFGLLFLSAARCHRTPAR